MKKKFCFGSIMHVNLIYIFLSVFMLIAGGIVYILFRPLEPDFFRWIYDAGFENLVTDARKHTLLLSQTMPEWVVYSLPNGLWAFAYSLFITGIWWKSESLLKYFWLASIPFLVLGFEFLQYAGLLQGTFCLQDIVAGLFGIITGILIGIKIIKIYNYEKDMV